MKSRSILSVLLLGTLFCVFYIETCNGNVVTNPAAVAESQVTPTEKPTATVTEEKKPGNTTVVVPTSTLSRARRQTCHNNEPPGHRCSNDCHCHRSRYCSSYGYCHERNRNGRLAYAEEVDYNSADEYP